MIRRYTQILNPRKSAVNLRSSAPVPSAIDILIKTRKVFPELPFRKIKEKALGKSYDLSLVICGDSLARAINKKYRKKAYAANVLSFPLSRRGGEIFLNAAAAAREAKQFGTTERKRLALLFVHGLLHLKGLHHGRTMEEREQKLLRAFSLL